MFSIITFCFVEGGFDLSVRSESYENNFCQIVSKNDIIIIDKESKLPEIYKNKLVIDKNSDLDEIFNQAYSMKKNNYIFVTGSSWLIKKASKRNELECLYQSIIHESLDTQLIEEIPIFQLKNFIKNSHFNYESQIWFRGKEITASTIEHVKWNKIVFNDFEQSYFHILDNVIRNGIISTNRTDIKTISLWGQQLRIDLSQGFPLMTTKFVPFKGLVNEMLFFLSGKTDTTFGINTSGKSKNEITNNVTKIWYDNTTREFLDNRELKDYHEGEAGPIYGFQWRHYGAKYIPNQQLSIGEEGIDQIQSVIDGIKAVKQNPSDPRGRRLIVCSWNPVDIDKMCLPPCHYSFQFSVKQDRLNCCINMRSSDLFLGLPWNMNYALLVHMIAHLTDLVPSELVFNLADAHIYFNCIDQINIQMKRNFRNLPRLEITRKHASIDEFSTDSFRLIDYNPHPALFAHMAV